MSVEVKAANENTFERKLAWGQFWGSSWQWLHPGLELELLDLWPIYEESSGSVKFQKYLSILSSIDLNKTKFEKSYII